MRSRASLWTIRALRSNRQMHWFQTRWKTSPGCLPANAARWRASGIRVLLSPLKISARPCSTTAHSSTAWWHDHSTASMHVWQMSARHAGPTWTKLSLPNIENNSLPYIRHCEGVLLEASRVLQDFSCPERDCFAARRTLASRNDDIGSFVR
jgi:hypothetical protein